MVGEPVHADYIEMLRRSFKIVHNEGPWRARLAAELGVLPRCSVGIWFLWDAVVKDMSELNLTTGSSTFTWKRCT